VNKRRSLIFIGSSKDDLSSFPDDVKRDIGYALHLAQLGDKAESAKPFKGIGSGVYEIVDDFNKDTYRAIYVVNIGEYVFVLHAFQKKSKKNIKTPKKEVDMIEKRYKKAIEIQNTKIKRGDDIVKKENDPSFIKGSDNVFADLGLPHPEEDLARTALTYKINKIIKRRHLTQQQAANILGVYQPRISDLVNGKISKFTLDNLIEILNKLDLDVIITTRRKPKARKHGKTLVKV